MYEDSQMQEVQEEEEEKTPSLMRDDEENLSYLDEVNLIRAPDKFDKLVVQPDRDRRLRLHQE